MTAFQKILMANKDLALIEMQAEYICINLLKPLYLPSINTEC